MICYVSIPAKEPAEGKDARTDWAEKTRGAQLAHWQFLVAEKVADRVDVKGSAGDDKTEVDDEEEADDVEEDIEENEMYLE